MKREQNEEECERIEERINNMELRGEERREGKDQMERA